MRTKSWMKWVDLEVDLGVDLKVDLEGWIM